MNTPVPAVATLQVLGPVALQRTAGVSSIPQLTQARPLAVLSYLVLARPRRLHSRDTLLLLLWPESDQAKGRHALRNVLHSIRKALGDEALTTSGDDQIGIAPGSIACDALEVESLVERREWKAALALYHGDLMSGFHVGDAPGFEDWLFQERTRYRKMMTDAASALVEERERVGDLSGAVQAAERRAQLAPDDEGGQRQLIQLLARVGEPVAALQVFERLEARLRTEYDTEPSRETREIMRALVRPASGSVPARPASEAAAPQLPVSAAAPSTAPAAGPPVRHRRSVFTGVAIAAALGALALFIVRTPTAATAPTGTLFVVPVVNATGDTAATWLGEGLTLSLRDQFARAGWRLVPVSRVRLAMQEHATLDDAARATGAMLLLTGRADSAAGQVRLSFAATAVGAERATAHASVPVQHNRLLDAETSAVRALIEQLRPGMAADSLVTALRRGTTDEAAYQFFLQGSYLWDRRFTRTDIEQASARFDSALAHDPVYADALAARARVHFAVAWSDFDAKNGEMAAARADARRAVELDSLSRVALSTLGAIETVHDSATARQLLERAVSLDPDRADTYFLLGLHYAFRGEYASAERALNRASELDPLTPFLYAQLAATQVCQGELERALQTLEQWRAVNVRPELSPVIDHREALLLLALGRWRDAVPLFQGAAEMSPGGAAALAGARSQEAVESVLSREAEAAASRDPVPSWSALRSARWRAHLAMIAGRRAEAVRLLTSAHLDGNATLTMACEDPLLAPLMREPEVVAAMRLPQGP